MAVKMMKAEKNDLILEFLIYQMVMDTFFRTLLALGYHVSMETKEKQQQNRMKMIKLGNK